MGRFRTLDYAQIIEDLATPEMRAFINSLPTACHTTIDRLLCERPITHPDDNWITRMAKLRDLDQESAIQLIKGWQMELDGARFH